jgi:hypothetical protein
MADLLRESACEGHVIASEAKQSSADRQPWISSSLRSLYQRALPAKQDAAV